MTVCVPTARVVLMAAAVIPPEVVTFTGLPKLLPSITNWTVPVGVPAPGLCTLRMAVKVTDWPDADGLGEDMTTMFVLALPTVCVRVAVLGRKLLSPP